MQLVQGERLAIESSDLEGWIRRFEQYPAVELIDLDAAKSEGSNALLIRQVTGRLPCRVGGGIRSVERARALLRDGARKVIFGSALYSDTGPNLDVARVLADGIGHERLIAAVDAKAGRVVVGGWRRTLPIAPEDAIRQLEPYVGEFLYTNVDREGLMQGIDRAAVERVRRATDKALAVAGGVTQAAEVQWLASLNIDAVVGMALYTGVLEATPPAASPSNGGGEANR